MSEAKMTLFQFRALHYDYDETAQRTERLKNQISVQFGCPKEDGHKSGAVRMKFQVISPGSALSLSGETITTFDLSDFEEEITSQLVEKVCWKKAYEEYSRHIASILKELGSIKNVEVAPFEELE